MTCLLLLGVLLMSSVESPRDDALLKAVTFYASFDTKPEGDYGQGDLSLWTRMDDPADKTKKIIKPGHGEARLRIRPCDGVRGGALEFQALTPNHAFVFFPAKGKLAVREDGWGGAVSLWVNVDVEKV